MREFRQINIYNNIKQKYIEQRLNVGNIYQIRLTKQLINHKQNNNKKELIEEHGK